MKRIAIAAVAAVVVVGCASRPKRGSSVLAEADLNVPTTTVSTSSQAAGRRSLAGQWILDPLGSEDPDMTTQNDLPKTQRRVVRGFRRRGGVVVDVTRNPSAPSQISNTSAVQLREILGKTTILAARELTITQTEALVFIKSDGRPLPQKGQRWETGQLVVVRKTPQAVAVERYTSDPSGRQLHVSVEVRVPMRRPMVFIRRFRRDAASTSSTDN